MEQTSSPTGGWDVVAASDEAAALIGAIIRLDVNETYTRSDLAEEAGVPLKELYLSETLTDLATIGLLRTQQSEGEATYAINEESPVYEQAAAFDTAVADQLPEESREA